MNIKIRPVTAKDYQAVYLFQSEYLDNESFDQFVTRIQSNPDLYILAFIEEQLVGICYGHPSIKEESVITLQGIAVNLDERKNYARKGIGSAMIQAFEQMVIGKGYQKMDVGSADDLKVEAFYLKNGFQPYELVAKGEQQGEYERIKISHYETGKLIQEKLRRKYNPNEVVFIFEKYLKKED